MKFSDLNLSSDITQILKHHGFTELTEVQQKVIPHLIKGKDVIVQSPTGTGKTLSYVVPIVEMLYNTSTITHTPSIKKTPSYSIPQSKLLNNTTIHALIITPTHELTTQISHILSLFTISSLLTLIGGTDIEKDIDILNSHTINTIICTPGRLIHILNSHKDMFQNIRYLILDEADKLLSLGFKPSLMYIFANVHTTTTAFFSATMDVPLTCFNKFFPKTVDNIVIGSNNSNNNTCIDITNNNTLLPNTLNIHYIITPPCNKITTLLSFKNTKSIIFFSTCYQVEYFYNLLSNKGINDMYRIHRGVKQEERSNVYDKYCSSGRWLLCTDICARGIDIKGECTVVHYDVPCDFVSFVHRSGRTGRNGRKGNVYVFVMESEIKYINYLKIKGIRLEECIRGNENEYDNNGGDIKEDSCYKDDSHNDNVNKESNDIRNIGVNNGTDNNTFYYTGNVNALVSYLRAYKKHTLSYILNYKELDLEEVCKAYCVDKVPESLFYNKKGYSGTKDKGNNRNQISYMSNSNYKSNKDNKSSRDNKSGKNRINNDRDNKKNKRFKRYKSNK